MWSLLKIVTLTMFLANYTFASKRNAMDIRIKTYFICENGKSLTSRKFTNYCNRNFDNSRMLYIQFDPSSEVVFNKFLTLNGKVGSTKNWCLMGRNNPACVIEFIDSKTFRTSLFNVQYFTENILKLNISALRKKNHYIIRLVEISSNTKTRPSLIENL